ncbi:MULTISPECIES: hypothetical protein [unclassified Nocardioides]|uniref:hypothetical protein n=1 Tax=unclassified Nocardioides TaxID=2615069 RepID=UPI000702E362|nr:MULTISPECIES: hypothetical protein [unclassified Nocardioides]KRC52849.1 hypothetical protein ASE19_10585 [Nocardioides sp. Root79]KRC72380.1 hypothetical protein ASE20_07120 [Nocardioides sp. Root240]
MTDPNEPRVDRPVLNGLVALVAVGLGVGLILALVAMVGTKMLGIDGADASAGNGSTVRDSMYLPTPVETVGSSGPLITLHTEDPDDVATEGTDGATEPLESETTEETDTASPKAGEISLQAVDTTVSSGERIYFSGVYPGGEGAILWLQRWQDGSWADFPASVGVTNGTFSSYIFTGVSGLNRFRVIDRDNGTVSNEIRVTVG